MPTRLSIAEAVVSDLAGVHSPLFIGKLAHAFIPPSKGPDELLLLPTFQQTCPEITKFSDPRFSGSAFDWSSFLIRFTAKSSAPLGSSYQSRLCSSARRINPKPRRARFRALRLRSAPEIDSASLRSFPRQL